MTLTPRADFKKSDYAKVWHEATASQGFHAAVMAALVEMELRLNNAPDMATATAWHFKMAGAKQFVGILMNLTEEAGKEPEPIEQNLPGNIRK